MTGCVLACALSLAPTLPDDPGPLLDVRVGIVAYQDFQHELSRYQELLSKLARKKHVRFRVAPGTYGEVLRWIDRGLVDLAVLSPGVFAETQKGGQGPRCRYLATLGRGPAHGPLALPDRRKPGLHYQYRAACVVAAGSSLHSAADLKEAADAGRVQFLFVDPLSVSGRIAPQFALKQIGIEPAGDAVEYTYSHSNSLRLLAEPLEDRERVAFVWDDALPEASPQASVRRLDFPELDALMVPQEVVAARMDFKHDKEIARLLEKELGFQRLPGWEQHYGVIHTWNQALGIRLDMGAQKVTLKDIGQDLLHFARSHPRPPRLALVLSGGGAKCAFQVGAVKALEEMLADLRRTHPDKGLDIALVVGTSGGAINSVPVALGVTATPEGRDDLAELWRSMDQRELIRPTARVRIGVGLWLTLLQVALVIGFVRRRVKEPARRGWVASWTILVLGALEMTLSLLSWAPWRLLGSNHTWHHLWLVVSFAAQWTGGFLLGAGLVGLWLQWWLARRQKHLAVRRRVSGYFFLTTLLGLPLLVVLCVFLVDKTVSGSLGIERAVIRKCTWTIDRHLARQGQPALQVDTAADNKERLAALSRQIIERRLLQRDLCITGSCLSRTSTDFPADLYFFAPGRGQEKGPRFGNQGVSLAERKALLLDVMMGSGAAYPIFPPRQLDDFPRPGESVQLVDGGFAHNSPLEAAVLWDATHIVLIEAFLEGRVSGNNLLQNAAGAVEHLWLQAQQIDARKRGQVVVYSLRPAPPHVCLLDFADNLIDKAIAKGYREARGEIPAGSSLLVGQPRFRKELGEPLFWTVGTH
jgi:predicted acylesterase/phospholipase RssA/ABC-type phosphate/phosphonate transport system substrate-binding protein